jgi:hypothetical protein
MGTIRGIVQHVFFTPDKAETYCLNLLPINELRRSKEASRTHYTGLTTRITPCHNHVFAAGALFCRKHHNAAKADYDAGRDIKAKYPTWNPDFDVDQEVNPTHRPLTEFVKSPVLLAAKIDSPGGARFKKAYVPNLKAALGVKLCQFCHKGKIEILTECSHLSCVDCFEDGIDCEIPHAWGTTLTFPVTKGWNIAGEHRSLTVINLGSPASPATEAARSLERMSVDRD